MKTYVDGLQARICLALEERDKKGFSTDHWKREGGGGGLTRVLEDGVFIEKGGVNVSGVWGSLGQHAAERLGVSPGGFAACGISLVIHPKNPRVPSIHMNVRYFEMESGDAWYGGGVDLTPYYPHLEDFRHFHQVMHDACESIIPGGYRRFKAQCDDYFTVKHRGEMRGIGGIFFDHQREDLAEANRLVQAVGEAFLPSYLPIVDARKDEKSTAGDREFQLIRRGRYVEFNLIYDRGTRFGLQTGGRISSILMSLPLEVRFSYHDNPEPGTKAAEMIPLYQPRDWLDS
jgi:coproporphyrinogen III oxidase